jgi:hypothetical protein
MVNLFYFVAPCGESCAMICESFLVIVVL